MTYRSHHKTKNCYKLVTELFFDFHKNLIIKKLNDIVHPLPGEHQYKSISVI